MGRRRKLKPFKDSVLYMTHDGKSYPLLEEKNLPIDGQTINHEVVDDIGWSELHRPWRHSVRMEREAEEITRMRPRYEKGDQLIRAELGRLDALWEVRVS